jgi:hypothetical protein
MTSATVLRDEGGPAPETIISFAECEDFMDAMTYPTLSLEFIVRLSYVLTMDL